MREIKFRAFGKNTKKMYYQDIGDDYITSLDFGSSGVIINHNDEDESILLFKHAEIMQFIGLKDKNGKEIYEGDIVKIINNPKKKKEPEEYIGEVKFVGWGFCVEFKGYNKFEGWEKVQHLNPEVKEVIGNIYENKELLKGDK